MKILVTGANGQLGRCISDECAASDDDYVFAGSAMLDITDMQAVKQYFDSGNYDVIINCAAYTDVEKAETDSLRAMNVNAVGAYNLGHAAYVHGATLIHISSDYVYDGNGNIPLVESAALHPANVYGRSKLEGELAIAKSGCNALILRTSWLYSEYGRNFVKTIRRLATEREYIDVVDDQLGCPTYARTLAASIVSIITHRMFIDNSGIYNFAGQGTCSWFDLAKKTVEKSDMVNCTVRPCRSSQYPSTVVRPVYSVLDTSKFRTTFNINIPHWIDSLHNCINNLNHNETS